MSPNVPLSPKQSRSFVDHHCSIRLKLLLMLFFSGIPLFPMCAYAQGGATTHDIFGIQTGITALITAIVTGLSGWIIVWFRGRTARLENQQKIAAALADAEANRARAETASAEARKNQSKINAVEGEIARQNALKATLERESEEGIAVKTQTAQNPPENKWAILTETIFKRSAKVTEQLVGRSKIVVIASGKGGVGKSTIALGLWEFYARTGPTLLVDFDMPNRGLTSLLRTGSDDAEVANTLGELMHFAELPQFRNLFPRTRTGAGATGEGSTAKESSKASGLVDYATRSKPEELRKDFYDLLREFTEEQGFSRSIRVRQFQGDPIPLPRGVQAITPSNCYFMPSVKPGDLFLSSSVFDAHFLEVFYFILCLANWARTQEGIPTIILDCHGAHDLFMVGAIHAATDLVVVTTPDPGSFDGTYDLLAFAQHLNKEVAVSSRIALVINNCRDWQTSSQQVMKQFFENKSPIKPGLVVGVQAEEDIRIITSKYSLGSALKSQLWYAIEELGRFFAAPPAPEIREEKIAPPEETADEGDDDEPT